MAMLESAEPLYSPGQSLRDARERAGLSQREVAERLNLTAGQIAALEADDHAALSGPTFVQGYLRAYGRLLGVAGDELVARYRASLEGQSSPRRPVRQRPTLDCGHSQRYWGLALLALVLTGLWGWQQQRAEEPPELADRKSTRLNSSHVAISYAVCCLKKKDETYANACIYKGIGTPT